ncbi:MAG: DUF3489 domain-containing protein [Hyphomicrobiaceae bacterium]
MKLSDTQLVILTAASQRDDRLALPLPDHLKGGAAAKVMASLIAKGLVEEVDAKRGDPVWRKTGDAHGFTLAITDAALTALGIEPEPGPAGRPAATVTDRPRTQRAPRKDSKQAQLIALLRRAKGATIEEIVEALDWQAHTVRGAIAGALKKKLGLTVVSEKSERRGRVYRITD